LGHQQVGKAERQLLPTALDTGGKWVILNAGSYATEQEAGDEIEK
jgi:hypothetical protein